MLLLAAVLCGGICTAAQAPEAGTAKKGRKRPPEFLVFGTVFQDKGFALAGAKVEVRVSGEKKVRGEAISDRRGEFGIRVKPGAEYEVRVEAPGFAPQSEKIDARGGNRADIVVRMKPAQGGKSK